MTLIEEAGEFNLIRQIEAITSQSSNGSVIAGIGDDAAVYDSKPGMVQVITTDALIEGYHFDFDFYEMDHVGHKAMAVNLSDIAAMNAQPVLATVALGIPGSFSLGNLKFLYEGLMRVADAHGVQIAGGDTTRSPVMMLSITVVGQAPASAVVYRNGAKPGDRICVSGNLGEAAAGLHLLRTPANFVSMDPQVRDVLTTRHLMPTPRLDLVNAWAENGVSPSALIDISDGLTSELHHICTASNCGAILWESKLPISRELRLGAPEPGTPIDYALNGGDDYELLFTAAPEMLRHMPQDDCIQIGEVTEQEVLIQRTDGTLELLNPRGHDHFRAPSST